MLYYYIQNHESSVCSAFFSIILTEQYSLLCTWHIGLSPSGSPGRCWCRAQATIFPYCWNQLSEIINCHGCWVDVGLCSSRQFGTPGNLAYAETLQTIQGHSGSFGICRNIRTSDWPTWWMHVGFQLKTSNKSKRIQNIRLNFNPM